MLIFFTSAEQEIEAELAFRLEERVRGSPSRVVEKTNGLKREKPKRCEIERFSLRTGFARTKRKLDLCLSTTT